MKIKRYLQFIKENYDFEYNNIIDYTLLEDSSTNEDIINLCKKGNQLGVKSVCIFPKFISIAKKELINSDVLITTVISFPSGNNSLSDKIQETKKAISDGADEIDMVLNYHMLMEKPAYTNEFHLDDYNKSIEEVKSLVDICHSKTNKNGEKVILKVIVESGLLSDEETEIATKICLESGADFIKTSTGKVSVGAELSKVKIMYDIIKESGKDMMIKASGGIRTLSQITELLPYVDRLGMGSGSVDKLNGIVEDNKSNY
jgi:deoxyribose-phosphate aldolase